MNISKAFLVSLFLGVSQLSLGVSPTQINIKSVVGKSFQIDITPEMTTSQFYSAASSLTGVPLSTIKLVLNGSLIPNDTSLISDYNIPAETSVVYLNPSVAPVVPNEPGPSDVAPSTGTGSSVSYQKSFNNATADYAEMKTQLDITDYKSMLLADFRAANKELATLTDQLDAAQAAGAADVSEIQAKLDSTKGSVNAAEKAIGEIDADVVVS